MHLSPQENITMLMKQAVDEKSIISFDIFDTMLLRPYARPHDLFLNMEKIFEAKGFYDARSSAEKKAWKRLCHDDKDDVTLDEIYQEIPEQYQYLKEEEINLERKQLFLNEEIYSVYQYARSQGKRLLFITDMYLPQQALQAILEEKLDDNGFELFVSSQYAKRKHTGRLFHYVKEQLSICFSDMLHIGDNKASDDTIPSSLGITCHHYQKKSASFEKDAKVGAFLKERDEEESRSFVSLLSGLYNNFLASHKSLTYWERLGFLYGGPIIYFYTQWLESIARQEKLDDILFVARDGYSIKAVFDRISKSGIKSHYVYAPRFTKLLTTLDLEDPSLRESRQAALNDFLKQHEHHGESQDTQAVCLQEYSQREREQYEDYLASLNLGNRIGIVDSISMSQSAQSLIAQTCKGKENRGFYWCFFGTQTDHLYSYYSLKKPFGKTFHFIELFAASPEPPIYRVNARKPLYMSTIDEYEEVKIKLYPEIYTGIMAFTQQMLRHKIDRQVSAADIVAWISSFMTHATQQDLERFEHIKNGVDLSHQSYVDVLQMKAQSSLDKAQHHHDAQSAVFISVVRDFAMYEKFVKNNRYHRGARFVSYDNRKENVGVATRYNSFLDSYDFKQERWLIFCHEDWQNNQAWLHQLKYLDKDSLYGSLGTRLIVDGDTAKKEYIGQIVSCSKDGSRALRFGKKVPTGAVVETLDCMTLIVHSSLINKYKIRFDERLDWHHYIEELCIRLHEKYGVLSRVLQANCRHCSWGVSLPNPDFDAAYHYVKGKFSTTSYHYSNTVVDDVVSKSSFNISRELHISPNQKMLQPHASFSSLVYTRVVLPAVRFLYQTKITQSGKHIIKICKIPVYVKRA